MKKQSPMGWGMAQWLWAQSALPEVQSSVPSTLLRRLTAACVSSSKGTQHPLLGPKGTCTALCKGESVRQKTPSSSHREEWSLSCVPLVSGESRKVILLMVTIKGTGSNVAHHRDRRSRSQRWSVLPAKQTHPFLGQIQVRYSVSVIEHQDLARAY